MSFPRTMGSVLAISVVCLAPAGCGAIERGQVSEQQAGVLGFRALDAGTRSGVGTPQEVVVRSPAEWEQLWRAHQSVVSPQRPLPAADFSKDFVVAIFAGQQPTGGFAVAVEQVTASASGIEVSYRVTAPPPGAIVPQALTSPFQIIAVPSRPGPVRFRRLPGT